MEDRAALILEITQWLQSVPDDQSILYYVRHLPEDHWAAVEDASRELAYELRRQKAAYFTAVGCKVLCTELDEMAQFNLILALSQYSAGSVLEKVRLAGGVLAGLGPLPDDIAVWAARYLASWNVASAAASCPEYLHQQVLVDTLVGRGLFGSVAATPLAAVVAAYDALQDDLKKEVKEGGLQVRKSLQELQIFPIDYIARLSSPEYRIEAQVLLSRLLNVLTLLEGLPLPITPQTAGEVLWLQLGRQYHRELLANLEIVRLRIIESPRNPRLTWAHQALSKVWALERLVQGVEVGNTLAWLASQPSQVRALLAEMLRPYLYDSPSFELLFRDLPVPGLIASIEQITDQSDLDSFIKDACDRYADGDRYRKMRDTALRLASAWLYELPKPTELTNF